MPLTKSVLSIYEKLIQFPSQNSLSVNPISIKKEIDQLTGDFGQSEQHDAHEFLANLLDFLMEEDLKTMKQAPTSERNRTFTMATQDVATVEGCINNDEFGMLCVGPPRV